MTNDALQCDAWWSVDTKCFTHLDIGLELSSDLRPVCIPGFLIKGDFCAVRNSNTIREM